MAAKPTERCTLGDGPEDRARECRMGRRCQPHPHMLWAYLLKTDAQTVTENFGKGEANSPSLQGVRGRPGLEARDTKTNGAAAALTTEGT